MEVLGIKSEGKRQDLTYNGSRIWFHFAICPSTGTSAVLAVVSGLEDTVTKTFLFFIKGYFLILGTLTAR
jgi:hypothetical protein